MPVISVFSGSLAIRELARGQPGGLLQLPAADRGQTVAECRPPTIPGRLARALQRFYFFYSSR